MRRRLMKEITNLSTNGESRGSTGVAEGTEITITMKKIVSEDTTIAKFEANSEWKAVRALGEDDKESNERDTESLAHLFFKLIST